MKQLTLAAVGFERYGKTTRRAEFLAEMERVVPWSALCALIEPFYPKPGNGRPPVGVERAAHLFLAAMVLLPQIAFCSLRPHYSDDSTSASLPEPRLRSTPTEAACLSRGSSPKWSEFRI